MSKGGSNGSLFIEYQTHKLLCLEKKLTCIPKFEKYGVIEVNKGLTYSFLVMEKASELIENKL